LLLYPKLLSFDWSGDAIPLVTTVSDRRNLGPVCLLVIATGLVCRVVWDMSDMRRSRVEGTCWTKRKDDRLNYNSINTEYYELERENLKPDHQRNASEFSEKKGKDSVYQVILRVW